jgi:hypothetical protein
MIFEAQEYLDAHYQDIGMSDETKRMFDDWVEAGETMITLYSKIQAIKPVVDSLETKYKAARLKELKTMPYEVYLQTPEWILKSRQAKEQWHKCQECGRSGELHVHHLTYERRGEELPEDLIVLCKDCHAKVHGLVEQGLEAM